VVCLGPRVPGESVGPRPLSGVVVRPLNFTVRCARVSPVTPHVVAKVTLSPTLNAGKRFTLADTSFREILGLGDEHFSARFDVPPHRTFSAGETVQVGIQFLVPAHALAKFGVGTPFTIWEGGDIGRGEVIEVLAHT
jgi:hypothetical protein